MAPVRMVRRHRSSVQRVTVYTRWTVCAFPWLFLVILADPAAAGLRDGSAPAPVAWAVVWVTVAQTVAATVVLASAVGQDRSSPRLVTGIVVVSAVQLATVPVLHDRGWLTGESAVATLCALVTVPSAGALSATVGLSTYAVATATACGLAVAATALSQVYAPWTAVAMAVAWASVGLGTRSSVWYLSVMRQLDVAREAQARLAVAEERLRFARDLHDVMGRNLAVIALKSELAARLGKKRDLRAVDEMTEVQRLARESQNEIRDVVRGYRTTDLGTELAGARSVLEAAGVTCRLDHDAGTPLPDGAEELLGWVVREGVTNILRHSEAEHCTIRLSGDGDRGTELLVTNDGAPPAGGPSGSGLAGLRQRLAPFGGSLEHGPGPENSYRLLARFPSLPDHSPQKAHP